MRMECLLLVILMVPGPVFAAAGAGDVRAGNDLYHQGKYPQALERYQKAADKNPSEAKIEYDLGAAAYKSGDFDAAAEHFQKSLLTDDDKLKPDVHFNLGDALYRGGVSHEDKDVDAAIRLLEGALGNFEKVLALNARDTQAADNREFIRKELERLKKKKEQQQQQNKNQSKDQPRDDSSSKDQPAGKDQPSDSGQQQEPKNGSADTAKEEPRDDLKHESQGKSGEQSQGSKDQQSSPASGQNDRGQISSQKEANDMVDDLERNDLPKGLLNFTRAAREPRPVDKDW